MQLNSLLAKCSIPCSTNISHLEITDITYDSRQCKHQSLFLAIKGLVTDGHKYVEKAFQQGTTAVIIDQDRLESVLASISSEYHNRVIAVPDTRILLPHLTYHFYDEPAKDINIFGVTGTNGKTTIGYMLRSIFEAADLAHGLIGTVEYSIKDQKFHGARTTPDCLELIQLFDQMRKNQVTHVAMEVSSHATALHRVDALPFAGMIFTNLTQDHLDFHKSMEEYLEAKIDAFRLMAKHGRSPKAAVIRAPDPAGDRVAQVVADLGISPIRYGINTTADYCAKDIETSIQGTNFIVHYQGNVQKIHLSLPGFFNVENALGAIALCRTLNFSWEVIKKGLASVRVPGRFDTIHGKDITVVVDYAHTPDALVNILKAIRTLQPKRLVTIFGCGGDRDKGKRPLMGEAASTYSDFVIITSDNPRSEDPDAIIDDIEPAVRNCKIPYKRIVQREQAIAKAISEAQKGDVILIAGKGHEDYQIIGDQTIHFDDREVALKLLKK